ncbi:hypothetical protein [Microvirga mediterraneensis]|uniref:Uncharacterized protein n=1 Tax=Microvirga mediterraneensis TaxID=2754695 RepID=A0A838BSK1_9HYPH|nr:hypothetical protein [Microvirga mediterraneensis]MBA1158019.1 hypothetical protein [Microvirga mediterraneensis]
MKNSSRTASFSWIGLYAVLGVSVATQAQAFFALSPRPPPNGANGISLNGLTVNGLTVNGLTVNGLTVNGRYDTGLTSKILAPHAVTLPNGDRIELR